MTRTVSLARLEKGKLYVIKSFCFGFPEIRAYMGGMALEGSRVRLEEGTIFMVAEELQRHVYKILVGERVLYFSAHGVFVPIDFQVNS